MIDNREINFNQVVSSDVDVKSRAWDLMGGRFWREGRKSAKPSQREINNYLCNAIGKRVLVIGASTRDLVEAAIQEKFKVTVADFSSVMGSDLLSELGENSFHFVHADILREPERIPGSFDLIIADRLVNRFIIDDLPTFSKNCCSLLVEGGELRTSIKLGFYPMDKLLIESGRVAGTLETFYDEQRQTFDFSRARDVLETITLEHGEIPRKLLLEWYFYRGRESRFVAGDINQAFASTPGWSKVHHVPFPDAPDTELWIARR